MPDEDAPPYLLSVEGSSDRHAVRALWNRLDSTVPLAIEPKGSDRQVLEAIPLDARAPDRIAFGVVIDANGNPAGRWQALADRFAPLGIVLPPKPISSGTVIIPPDDVASPRIGIWMMPDNGSPGALEDFLETMVPAGDPLWPEAGSYVARIAAIDRRFALPKRLRAVIYSWLAVQRDPRQPGQAIAFGNLDANAPLAVLFQQWLRDLFDPGGAE